MHATLLVGFDATIVISLIAQVVLFVRGCHKIR